MKIENRRTIFNGLVINIEEMDVEIGSLGFHKYQIIRHPGGSAVLPVHDDGTISLIRQLRPAVGKSILEIPAGRLSDQEPPIDCAARELLEETGISATKLIPLGTIYSSPGVFDEIIHLFAATGLTQGDAQPESDEDIEVLQVPASEVKTMILDGRICDAKTMAAFLRWEILCHTTAT